ncbi:TAXI family TRAP transporter solute-binding subunit [Chloroflexota bacterium]
MKKAWRSLLTLFMVVLVVPLMAACTPTAEKPAEEGLPNMVSISCYGSGSKGYLIQSAMANVIEERTGMKARVVPGGNNKARAMMLARGETQIGVFTGHEVYQANGGIWAWLDVGPHFFNLIWAGPGDMGLATTADSGIKTWEDIKGKRVASFEKHDRTYHASMQAYLAFGGLTYDDVIPCDVPNTAAGCQALVDGACDVTPSTTSSSAMFALGSSVHGVHWLQFPPDNKEGWKRLREIAPLYSPLQKTYGAGVSEENPVWVPGTYYPMFTTPDSSEELIYTVVKALYEGYDGYKDTHPEAKDWHPDFFLKPEQMVGAPQPMHPGAIKYYKELGLWTEWHDRWQQNRLELFEKVKQLHKDTVDWAMAQEKPVPLGSSAFEKQIEPEWEKLFRTQLTKEF